MSENTHRLRFLLPRPLLLPLLSVAGIDLMDSQSSLQNLEYWAATFTALPHFGQDARPQTSLSNDGSSGISSSDGRRSR